nr:hypothetical protein [Tanacetum cinerariifolium]
MKQVDQYAQAIFSILAIVDCYIGNKQGESIQQAILEFATPVIERNVTELLVTDVLAKSSSQPKSTYEAVASHSEFKLTKILMDKMKEHKSYLRADYKRKIYDALVKSYNTDKYIFETYGEVFTLKRSRDDKDKDQDLSARSDRGTKRRKSKFDTGNNDEQPDDEATSKVDWFKKSEQPLTPDPDWNKRQHVDFRPSQT